MHRQFAVIGLGQFGRTIALELMRQGHEVLGLDNDQKLVNQLAPQLTQALVVDATDESALAELNLGHCDAVVVAIGEDIQSSILCTLHLKSLKVNQIWVKALTPAHHKILAKLGADRIVHPEHEMGLRVAQSLNYPAVQDYIALGNELFLVEIAATELLDGKDVASLNLAKRNISLVAHKRGTELLQSPPPELSLAKGDALVLLGKLGALQELSSLL
ncbi:TrkA family potassium uptake protein [Gallaecimonas kandeliae]|uniref:potassium channel family protein n=1 Tax=Gallaecimonas kandeliae TaxID=3029055 RepID=UPI002649E4A7|nr:TrkA family potassium uptake protein [Gallaecimonas kandeliae]WKE64871.1 TrkA family potassium uptake protein [Gallaecimonas kandeliae]